MKVKIKGKVYKTMVRPATVYEAKTWAVKKAHEKKMNVAEMKMSRWMCVCSNTPPYRMRVFTCGVGVVRPSGAVVPYIQNEGVYMWGWGCTPLGCSSTSPYRMRAFTCGVVRPSGAVVPLRTE